MKNIIVLFVLILLVNLKLEAQISKTVGGTGADYTNLKAAFDKINDGTLTGAITLQITGTTTEAVSAILYHSGYTGSGGTSSYGSITIYPTSSGVSISGSLNSPLLELNGADNVILDGRVNASGSTNDLKVVNSNTGTAASTIRFLNSAENNTVKYCIIEGSETSSATSNPTGIVFFSTSTSGNGNDGNTIDNNYITTNAAGRPTLAIHSKGSGSYENSGNIVSNNKIYNFLSPNYSSSGILLNSYTTSWELSDNSFYETTAFAPGADVSYSIIKIDNTTGTNFTITNNYIGGTTSLCGGTSWAKTNAYNNSFFAINLNIGNTVASSVQGNTIKNFSWSNSGSAAWTGIQVTVGSVNIGTVDGNTIGSLTGTGSISYTGGASGATVYGISIAGSGTISIANNTISSFTVANANTAFSTNFYGINRANTGTTSIISNSIGSTTTNSIQASSQSTSNDQTVIGIYNSTAGTLTVASNIIDNLTNGTSNSDASSRGLVQGIVSTYGANTITNNIVRNLSIANANNASDHLASVGGILITGTNALKTISGNEIYNINNSYNSFSGSIIGLYFGATGMYTTISHTVTRNLIHSLTISGSSSNSASIYGIKIYTGQTTYANNLISLGGNTATNLYGIYETGTASNNNSIYYNSIYIGGSLGAGVSNKSYALYSAVSTNTRNFRNNIFENSRSTTSGSSLHYAIYFNYAVSTLLTLDFNNYYASGTGGVLGYYNGLNVNTLPLISGMDAGSMATNPNFTSPGGTTASNYIPTNLTLAGTSITTITDDYNYATRAGTPTIGAYEVSLDLNVEIYIANVFQSGFTTLKLAFDKINSGIYTGNIEIRIKSSTTETASAVLFQSGYTGAGGASNYTAVSIYPVASGVTISGDFSASLIDINGADNITIDGRVNHSGAADLILSNINTGSFSSAIRFIGSAESNTVKYCNLKSSCYSTGVGMVNFTSSTTGNGNDNNIIEYNNITNAGNRPINAIFSSGSTGRENSGNTIRNNNVYNFFNPNSNSYGINLSYNTTGWTISGNSFYDTETIVPTGDFKYYNLNINTGTHTISNNYIGGSAPLCAGTAWTINSNKSHYFCAIFINSSVSVASTVENNLITNLFNFRKLNLTRLR